MVRRSSFERLPTLPQNIFAIAPRGWDLSACNLACGVQVAQTQRVATKKLGSHRGVDNGW